MRINIDVQLFYLFPLLTVVTLLSYNHSCELSSYNFILKIKGYNYVKLLQLRRRRIERKNSCGIIIVTIFRF